MKMKQFAVAAAAAGLLTMGGALGVSAAGIGYVNTNALMQAHPKMEKARLDMRAAAQKAEEDFEKRADGKSDEEKQRIATELQRQLNDKNGSLMNPIVQDIQKAIAQVRQEKGLDIVIDQAAVIDGGVDITTEVGQRLAQ